MKILIINANENNGGAAKAANRLYCGLLHEGIDAYYLVDNKISDDFRILSSERKIDKLKKIFRQQYEHLRVRLYKYRTRTIFSLNNTFFNSGLIKQINMINPDIVHFHWVNGGMINIKDLLKIKKPIVWTMHDSWLFTGGCHLPYECRKFESECKKCPVLGSDKNNDLSNKVFNIKKKIFSKLKLNIVTPSNWLANNCKKSMLLHNKNINIIPNPIDTIMYKPIPKNVAREILNLPNNKKIILFSASSATSDPNKGFRELNIAINSLKLDDVFLLVMGGCMPKENNIFKYPIKYLGQLNDDISIKLVYNSANVSVVPSLSENLSNTIMESLSCATPVVAFDIGGNSDMCVHKVNGYLAKPFDCKDFADGIEWVLNTSKYNELCLNSRKKILNEFDSKIVTKRYIKLYKKILNQKQ
jgi:hypothetical protein